MKKKTALVLVLSLLLSHGSMAAQFSFSIDTPLTDGLTYIESTDLLEDGKDSHTYVFEYIPGHSAFPIVAWGETQRSRKTLSKIADIYDGDVIAGINADFFSFTTGIPLGCVVSEGRFLSSSVKNNALAVYEDGSLYIGTPDISSTITYGENIYDFYYNKYPQPYSLYIMDNTYGSSTASTYSALEIVLKPDTDILNVGSTVQCIVTDVLFDTMDTAIPEGGFVLNVPKAHASYKVLETVQVGDVFEINVNGSEEWSEAVDVIGGGEIIVKDSQFVPETADEYSDKVRYARSAVGIREDGSAIFFAVNGKRTNYSSGMSFSELAEVMIKKGAVTVLNLDGGGSTTVGVKFSDDEGFKVVNYPTDGYPRGIANAILFLNTAESDGTVSNAVLFPDTFFVLPGASVKADSAYFDSSMARVDGFEPFNIEYFPLSDGVSFDISTMKVEEHELYEREVAAVYTLEDGTIITDDKTFYVPNAVDTLIPDLQKQVLSPGEKTTVSVKTEYHGFNVANSAESFSWSFSENNLTELSDGVLAENDVARLYTDGTLEILTEELFRTATLTATLGDVSGSVAIYVGMPDIVLDDFEPDIPEDTEDIQTDGEEIVLEESTDDGLEEKTAETDAESVIDQLPPSDTEVVVETPVAFGYKSNTAGVAENGSLTYSSPIEVEVTPKAVTLMYNGKYTIPAYLVVIDSLGNEISVPYTIRKDFSEITDWTQLEAVIPEDLRGTVFISSPFVSEAEETVYIDDLTASYGYELPVFDDIENSWAKDYIRSIYDMGLIGGYTEDGKTLFAPDRQITRAEFAKLVSSYQKYAYTEGALNFNDTSDIPEWALGYVSAVSENNIMNGRAEGDGSLTFAPNDPITRTEAMLVLARIMPEVSETAELVFTDSGDVPDWAEEGVKKTVATGIITGYDDNTLKPSNNITRAETAVVFSRLFAYMYPTPEEETEEDTDEVENEPVRIV